MARVILLLLIIFPTLIFSETAVMEEVVVTGKRLESTEEDTPAFISVLKPSDGLNNKEGIFEKKPGLFLNSYGSSGDLLTPSIRGSSSDQVLILIDGMRVKNSTSSSLSLLSLEGIDRIEIMRGGGSSLYGSDAVGGVVNIITANPGRKPFDINLGYGSFGTFSASLSSSYEFADFGYSINAKHTQSKGDFKYTYRDEKLTRENNGFISDAFQAKVSRNSKNISFTFSNRFEVQKKEVPGSYFTPTPEGIQREWENQAHLSVKKQMKDLTLAFDASDSYHYLYYHDNVFVLADSPSVSRGNNPQAIVKVDAVVKNNIVSVSPEFRIEVIDSTSAGRHARTVAGIFIQDEINILDNRFIVLPAIRGEYYSDKGGIETGRLGIRVKPWDFLWIKGNAATSFRMPSFLDLYWPEDAFAKGNPALVPERGMDGDIGGGVRYGFLRGEISYFHNYIRNMIQWQPSDSGKWTPKNIGIAELQGAEAQLSFNALDFVTIGVSYTYLHAVDLTKGLPSYGKRLIYRPEDVLSINLSIPVRRFKFSLDYIYNSGRFTDMQNDPNNRLPAYSRIDAGIGYSDGRNFSAELSAKNIADNQYEEIPGYPQPGRNLNFTINYKI